MIIDPDLPQPAKIEPRMGRRVLSVSVLAVVGHRRDKLGITAGGHLRPSPVTTYHTY
jgi:hypothetical protein